ncbi:MAG TPA: hypothetical protein PK385_10190 [Spirochaetota bacterium]|nr:hypothetical protein [Spirochaetota bacterium]HOS32773.1 hypothetical protein [Spirochaetota bacterium]HOS56415.1 hypothetical protein [Spirochaetota bacterium]HQF76633.1 hypothetical protein [Spirochaetota bacterium]HQH29887.1 hypothetical protein [Spirochaetota bacterium]
MKKVVLFTAFFLALSCSTFEFGVKSNMFEEKKSEGIREYNLNYQYRIMGFLIKGEKSVVEGFWAHPDGATQFIFISFPKIGILKTTDNGETFTSNFFRISSIDRHFGYSSEEKNENAGNAFTQINNRLTVKFFQSPDNLDRIIVSLGDYIFITEDRGEKWASKRIFYDTDKSRVIDVLIPKNDTIVVFSENKVSFSTDFGKKWKTSYIKIGGFNIFSIKYIAGLYDESNDAIFASFIHKEETDAELSKNSYEYFYNGSDIKNTGGVYYTKDFGANWTKTAINVPVVLWKNNGQIYGASIYPTSLYRGAFSEDFKNSNFYKKAEFKKMLKTHNEYLDFFLASNADGLSLIPKTNNRILRFRLPDDKPEIFEETDFDNIYIGLSLLQNLDYIQADKNLYYSKKTENFFYEYDPYRMFKLWTGAQTGAPVIISRDESGDYYRIRPDDKYWDSFVKYSIEHQIRINNINPFLKNSGDIEFFDPARDPTNGFPVVIEKSADKGESWSAIADSKLIGNIIDPLGNKRSGFYWYKNVEQKKSFKLQLSFGFDQGISFFQYPFDIEILHNNAILITNYFTLSAGYKDMYIIPIK